MLILLYQVEYLASGQHIRRPANERVARLPNYSAINDNRGVFSK